VSAVPEQVIRYYPAGKVIARFHASGAPVRCIRGPVGSGKTTACCVELIRRSQEQQPSPDGVRHSRWAIIRNTAPQLTTTTLRTFQELVPATHARVSMDSPITVRLQAADLDAEFLFLALDVEPDVRKLLSLELTGAFVNEAREVALPIIDQLTARVGRYPSARAGGCTWSGIVMDSNAPDAESWWYRFAEVEHPGGWEFFAQPGGLGPDAENLANLNQNAETLKLPANHPKRLAQGRAYYERISAGKSADWRRVYVDGEYGFSQDGRPVFSEYSDTLHCYSGPIDASPRADLTLGVDFGLGGSAAVFCQREGDRWTVVHELVVSDMGVESFGRLLGMELAERFPGCEVRIWTDPAGIQRSQIDERTPLGILRQLGLPARAAPTNDLMLRLEAIRRPLTRLSNGAPAFQVFERCTKLRKALSGAYHYRRVYVGGGERFHDLPEKDQHSHIVDALGYALCGGGEHKPQLKPGYRQWKYAIMGPGDTGYA
jgi:hypothetical protein